MFNSRAQGSSEEDTAVLPQLPEGLQQDFQLHGNTEYVQSGRTV